MPICEFVLMLILKWHKCSAPDKWFEKLKSATTIFWFQWRKHFLFYCHALLCCAADCNDFFYSIFSAFFCLLRSFTVSAVHAFWSFLFGKCHTIRNFFLFVSFRFFYYCWNSRQTWQLNNEIHSNFSVIQLTLTVAKKSQHRLLKLSVLTQIERGWCVNWSNIFD